MRIPIRWALAPAAALIATMLAGVPAAGAPPSSRTGPPTSSAADLDVLYVGAHPDDEAWALSTFGQWNEDHDLKSGVITVTRGEGGGNAVGLEEGPELGILREAEERRAVANAGIENVYNLDKIDLYYTLSAPLHDQAWDGEPDRDDTLERMVRVVRSTKPEVIVTMDPSPGNHGGHQQAARLAVEAYAAAADPDAFPSQITDEALRPWSVSRILRSGASGTGVTGSACETTAYEPSDVTDRVFGTWEGRMSAETGETWAMRERRAQWEYASQGWAVFPPPAEDPEALGCDWFTVIDSRTPYPEPGSGSTAAVEGAALPGAGGLPLGTELTIDADRFTVLPGTSFQAEVRLSAGDRPLVGPQLQLDVPDGWTAEPTGELPDAIGSGRHAVVDLVVTPAEDAPVGTRSTLAATVTTRDGATGTNETAVETEHEVSGRLSPLSETALFNEWTEAQQLPKLATLVEQTTSIGTARTEEVSVDVTNSGMDEASGTVTLDLPDGFEAGAAEQPFTDLGSGESTTVTFEVSNTDTSLPTSSNADGGGYPFQVITDVGQSSDVTDAMIELVPTTTVPELASAPAVDGVAGDGEYPGDELDVSTHWEGEEVGAADASATARVSFTEDALYVLVEVTDDVLGTALPPEDCKRHWRTDSVELTIDPRGTSENASTAFKTGIFPVTDDPEQQNAPCYERDADNHQGPGAETAPGMEVASVINEPYGGYTIEAKIPYEDLPDTVDPDRMGFDVLIYDSDTDDKTGQTRLGWSTFSGIQADPTGWGLLQLPGLADQPSAPVDPILPSEAALSIESPQSIAQSSVDGVPLGGGPGLDPKALRIESASVASGVATATVRTGDAGMINAYLWDGETVLGSATTEVPAGRSTIEVPVDESGDDLELLLAFSTDEGTAAAARSLD